MNFPRFPNNIKTHMPFVTKIEDKEYYLCSIAEKDSNKWKIYIYKDNEWKRLTNNPDSCIECNACLSKQNGKFVLSYLQSGFDVDTGMKVLEGDDLNSLQEKEFMPYVFSGFETAYLKAYVLNKNEIHIESQKWNEVFKIKDVAYVYKCGFVPQENKIILTCKKNGQNGYENYLCDGDKVYLVECDDLEAYKYAKYNNEYWYTVRLDEDFENRYIRKAKVVSVKQINVQVEKINE